MATSYFCMPKDNLRAHGASQDISPSPRLRSGCGLSSSRPTVRMRLKINEPHTVRRHLMISRGPFALWQYFDGNHSLFVPFFKAASLHSFVH
jgi:hypothetical protein